jgi:hypothetical protein
VELSLQPGPVRCHRTAPAPGGGRCGELKIKQSLPYRALRQPNTGRPGEYAASAEREKESRRVRPGIGSEPRAASHRRLESSQSPSATIGVRSLHIGRHARDCDRRRSTGVMRQTCSASAMRGVDSGGEFGLVRPSRRQTTVSSAIRPDEGWKARVSQSRRNVAAAMSVGTIAPARRPNGETAPSKNFPRSA